MSARDRIAERLWWGLPSSDDADAKAKASAMLDAYRAEVVAERDAQIIAWLGKKAREYRGNRAESASDALARMASKIARGAVRPTPTAGQAPVPGADPSPTLTSCPCGPDAKLPCGHCPNCDRCEECGNCSGSGCTCRCEAAS